METIVKSHDPAQPLFLYMAFQNVHDPVQVPQQYILIKFIKNDLRRTYTGMVDITVAFKPAGYVEVFIVKFRALHWLHN